MLNAQVGFDLLAIGKGESQVLRAEDGWSEQVVRRGEFKGRISFLAVTPLSSQINGAPSKGNCIDTTAEPILSLQQSHVCKTVLS